MVSRFLSRLSFSTDFERRSRHDVAILDAIMADQFDIRLQGRVLYGEASQAPQSA